MNKTYTPFFYLLFFLILPRMNSWAENGNIELHMDSYSFTMSAYTFCEEEILLSLPPINDACSSATSLDPLTEQEYGFYSNLGATSEASDPLPDCFAENTVDNSTWFTFTGDGLTYNMTVTDCSGSSSAVTDSQMAIFDGSDCNSLTELDCSEDYNAADFYSQIILPTSNGTTYYVMVDGYEGDEGDFCLDVKENCLYADSLELVNFYNATGGGNWTDNSGWLVSPVEDWFGVTLSADGCEVMEIDLVNNNLSGDLINLDLSDLIDLNLRNNELSGEIIDFSNLSNLISLNLGGNQLSGEIPDFSNLSNLTHLILSNNQATGSIPNFSNLPNLVELVLNHNELTGNIPNFNNTFNLIGLHISRNNLTGNIPSFENLPNLLQIHVHFNQLSGEIPDFNNLSTLSCFWIQENHFIFSDVLTSWNFLSNIEESSPLCNPPLNYSPQATIPLLQASNTLYAEVGGLSDNHYKWFKDGTELTTISADSSLVITESGNYYVQVTNDIVTNPSISQQNLILTSEELFIELPPSNDNCPNAISLDPLISQVYGSYSNVGATADFESSCIDFDNNVWFSFTGTGNLVSVDVFACGDNPIPTTYEAAFYRGTSCGDWLNFACTSAQGEQTSLDMGFSTDPSLTYFITVDGDGITEGDFCIEITGEGINSGICSPDPDGNIYVTTLSDNGDNDNPTTGSLRAAIICANETAGANTIYFSTSDFAGSSPYVIQPLTALPTLTDAETTIDAAYTGNTSTGYIELDGSLIDSSTEIEADGLTIQGNNGAICGLYIHSFPDEGVVINNCDGCKIGETDKGNIIAGNGTANAPIAEQIIISEASNINIVDNFIGTGLDGNGFSLESAGDSSEGIYLYNSSNVTIGGDDATSSNVISGNTGSGVWVESCTDIVLKNNHIGIGADGETDLGNSDNGIRLSNSTSITIGGVGFGNLIGGNGGNGISIENISFDIFIENNKIGTNSSGNTAVANGINGIFTDDSFSIVINEENLISGNGSDGISLSNGSHFIEIKNNKIGTNQSGLNPLGNTLNGIRTSNSFVIDIGSEILGEGNIISANGEHGIRMDEGSDIVTIEGNIVGLDVNATADLGNTSNGIYAYNSTNINIGGLSDEPIKVGGANGGICNTISGNDENGIYLWGNLTNNVLIQDNYIGLNSNGTAFGNTNDGIVVADNVQNTIIEGGNIISGNSSSGVWIHNFAIGTIVRNNKIGTTIDGTGDLGNGFSGIAVGNFANNTTIGGTEETNRNIISGNGHNGIWIGSSASNTQVNNNFIGTNLNGTAAIPNDQAGISIESATNSFIGGADANTKNIISGNGGDGIDIEGSTTSNTQIQNNWIGLNINGETLGNAFNGIAISNNASNTTIETNNVISGNGDSGIWLTGISDLTTITGNKIGTDPTGTIDRGNENDGIAIQFNGSSTATIGGTTTEDRNLISGNTASGILVESTNGTVNIDGNYVGTDANGIAAIPNSGSGIYITDASNTLVGTNGGNVISGNNERGIFIDDSDAITVQRNFIGTNSDFTATLPNSSHGIEIWNSTNTLIGNSLGDTDGNTVANNPTGIGIYGSSDSYNIHLNSFYCNSNIPIDIDTDNSSPSLPTITSATSNGIAGTSIAAETLELFLNDDTDCGNAPCQGKIFLGRVTADTNGSWAINSSSLTQTLEVGQNIVATASSVNNYTSQFTDCFEVCPVIDVLISGDLAFCTGKTTQLTANDFSDFTADYTWSNGEQNQAITISTSGIYTVTVTDGGICTGTASVVITENNNPTVILNAPDGTGFCAGNSIEILAEGASSAGSVFYNWSNGQDQATLSVLSGGVYTVTVTDLNSCGITASVLIEEWESPSPNIEGENSFCTGESVVLSADVVYHSHQWSNGATTFSIEVNTGGDYSLTVSTEDNCSATTSTTISEFPLPTPTIEGQNTLCLGESTVLTTTETYTTYTWSNGSEDPSIEVSESGIYFLTVTTSNDCSQTTSFSLEVLPTPDLAIEGNLFFCSGSSTLLEANTAYHSYLWSNNSQQPSIEVNTQGTYGLTVTNTEGCSDAMTIFVVEKNLPSVVINGNNTLCTPILLNAFALGGSGDYQFEWSTGDDSQEISISETGIYSVTITDSDGCSATDIHEVTTCSDCDIVADFSLQESYCFGEELDLSNSLADNANLDGTWTIVYPSGNIATIANEGGSGSWSVTLNEAGTYSINYQVVDPLNPDCTAEYSVFITVQEIPDSDWTTETGGLEFCASDLPIRLLPNSEGGIWNCQGICTTFDEELDDNCMSFVDGEWYFDYDLTVNNSSVQLADLAHIAACTEECIGKSLLLYVEPPKPNVLVSMQTICSDAINEVFVFVDALPILYDDQSFTFNVYDETSLILETVTPNEDTIDFSNWLSGIGEYTFSITTVNGTCESEAEEISLFVQECGDCTNANVDLAEGTGLNYVLCEGETLSLSYNESTLNYGPLMGSNPSPVWIVNTVDPMGDPLENLGSLFLPPMDLEGNGIADTLWFTLSLIEDAGSDGTIITFECRPLSETVEVIWSENNNFIELDLAASNAIACGGENIVLTPIGAGEGATYHYYLDPNGTIPATPATGDAWISDEIVGQRIIYIIATTASGCDSAPLAVSTYSYENISVSNLTTVCNELDNSYTVSFDISGGNGVYTVNEIAVAEAFTSNPISQSEGYSFAIDDSPLIPSCFPLEVSGAAPACSDFIEAIDDFATVEAGQSVIIDVIKNDTGCDLTVFALLSPPSCGSILDINPITGAITYLAEENTTCTFDSFVYEIVDCNGNTANATITIAISPTPPDLIVEVERDCSGAEDFGTYTLFIRVIGGTAPFTVSGSINTTLQEPDIVAVVIEDGVLYQVTVVDAAGNEFFLEGGDIPCTKLGCPEDLIVVEGDLCPPNNPSVTLYAALSSEIAPYNYQWSNGQNTQSIEVSNPDIYWVTVSPVDKSHQCIASIEVLNECPPINATNDTIYLWTVLDNTSLENPTFPVSFNLLQNDLGTGITLQDLQYDITPNDLGESMTFTENGNVVFYPTKGEGGTQSFPYEIVDKSGQTANAELHIEINVISRSPETASDLVASIVGECVPFENAVLTGATNAYLQMDNFLLETAYSLTNTENNTLPSSIEGILLSTGNAYDGILSPNTIGSLGTNNGLGGDSDLTAGTLETFDATVLEFDFTALSESIAFRYWFGSEEYPEWAESNFEDRMAIFISGVGYEDTVNIATILDENSSTLVPVGVETINQDINSNFFQPNEYGVLPQYDGVTTLLEANATDLKIDENYHIKIVIADVGDNEYDSGLFIEANTDFADLQLEVSNDVTINSGESTQLSADIADAPSNIAYEWTPSETLNNANSSTPMATPTETTTYTVKANLGACQWIESVIVTVENPCTGIAIGALESVNPYVCFEEKLGGNTQIVAQDVSLREGDMLGYILQDATDTQLGYRSENANFGFDELTGAAYNTPYFIIAVVGPDTDGNGQPDLEDVCVQISNAIEVVFLEEIQILHSVVCEEGEQFIEVTLEGGLPAYLESESYDLLAYDGAIFVGETVTIGPFEGMEILAATDGNTCGAELEVELYSLDILLGDKDGPPLPNDTLIINSGEFVDLFALVTGSVAVNYSWTPTEGLSFPFIPNVTASPDTSTTYTIEVMIDNNCVLRDSVTILVLPAAYDCVDAIIPCDNSPIEYNSGGAGIDEIFNDPVLQLGENYSTWIRLQIHESSPPNEPLTFTIQPNDNERDYDFALYKGADCTNLGKPVRGSYASSSNPPFSIQTGLNLEDLDVPYDLGDTDNNGFAQYIEVNPGEVYYLLVDNFGGNLEGFTLEWTNPAIVFDCTPFIPCQANAGITKVGDDICAGETYSVEEPQEHNANLTQSGLFHLPDGTITSPPVNDIPGTYCFVYVNYVEGINISAYQTLQQIEDSIAAGLCMALSEPDCFEIFETPPSPTFNDSYCEEEILHLNLNAADGATLVWYSDEALQDSIGEGNDFHIDVAGTYFVIQVLGDCESTSLEVVVSEGDLTCGVVNCPEDLVNNSSFEDFDVCPEFGGDIREALFWRSPTGIAERADYFNSCNEVINNYGTPQNIVGNQSPSEGAAYVGLKVYRQGSNNLIKREFIQSELNSALEVGKSYCVSLQVSLADDSQFAIDNLGIYFSNERINSADIAEVLTPQVTSSQLLQNTDEWIQVQGVFTAQSTFQHFAIGNFSSNNNSMATEINPNGNGEAYYYIDEVNIRPSNEITSLNAYDEEGTLLNEEGNLVVICPNESITLEAETNVSVGNFSCDLGWVETTGNTVEQMSYTVQPVEDTTVYHFWVSNGVCYIEDSLVVVLGTPNESGNCEFTGCSGASQLMEQVENLTIQLPYQMAEMEVDISAYIKEQLSIYADNTTGLDPAVVEDFEILVESTGLQSQSDSDYLSFANGILTYDNSQPESYAYIGQDIVTYTLQHSICGAKTNTLTIDIGCPEYTVNAANSDCEEVSFVLSNPTIVVNEQTTINLIDANAMAWSFQYRIEGVNTDWVPASEPTILSPDIDYEVFMRVVKANTNTPIFNGMNAHTCSTTLSTSSLDAMPVLIVERCLGDGRVELVATVEDNNADAEDFVFEWSSGQTTQEIEIDAPFEDFYAVRVARLSDDCQGMDSIYQIGPPDVDIEHTDASLCFAVIRVENTIPQSIKCHNKEVPSEDCWWSEDDSSYRCEIALSEPYDDLVEVVVTDSKGCTDSIALFTCKPRIARIKPNPSTRLFTVELEGIPLNTPLAYKVYNMDGRLVLESDDLTDNGSANENWRSISIELGHGFLSSMYILRFEIGGDHPVCFYTKLIKMAND